MCEITLRDIHRLRTAAQWYDNVKKAMQNGDGNIFFTDDCFPETDMTTAVDGDIIVMTDVNAVLALSDIAARMAMIKMYCEYHNNCVFVSEIEFMMKGVKVDEIV